MSAPTLLYITLIYLAVINAVTFVIYGVDKWKAKKSKWCISEATLLGMAVIGGSIGAWLGMKVWHHKTLHKKFRYGIPLILIVQFALLILTACGTKQKVVDLQQHEYIPEHSPSVLIIMYDKETGKGPLLKAANDYKAEIIYDYSIIPSMAIKKPDSKTLEETMQYFKQVKGVVSVEYDHVYHLTDPVKPKLEIK